MSTPDGDLWVRWVQAHAGVTTQAQVASIVGVNQSTVTRWAKHGASPDVRVVVRVARKQGWSVRDALVGAGWITAAEADDRHAAMLVQDVPTADLLRILADRLPPRR